MGSPTSPSPVKALLAGDRRLAATLPGRESSEAARLGCPIVSSLRDVIFMGRSQMAMGEVCTSLRGATAAFVHSAPLWVS